MSADRYKYFRIEARDITEQLGRGALELDKGAAKDTVLPALLRHAHTLKGAARVVGQRDIADCAHAIEELLGAERGTDGGMSRQAIDDVLAYINRIDTQLRQLAGPVEAPGTPAPHSPDPATPVLDTPIANQEIDELLDAIFAAHAGVRALSPGLGELGRSRQIAALVTDQLSRPRQPDSVRSTSAIDRARTMTDDLGKLLAAAERRVATGLEQLQRELDGVREAAEQLRLVSAGTLFNFLERALRDAARTLDKRIVFEATGGDVRLDPSVVTAVQGALLHVVRNAAVHGIEDEATRRTAGKPPEGRVSLEVSQRGRMVSVVCRDDGRGIDLNRVRSAIDAIDGMSSDVADEAALMQRLLRGGISTVASVSGLAGRGIGLDAVREAIERLGGQVSLHTEPGQGTVVRLSVPLSIAAFPALIAVIERGTIAIPLGAVRATVRLSESEIIRGNGQDSMMFEDVGIPLVSLQQALSPSLVVPPTKNLSAIVVQGRERLVAFSADWLLGVQPIVMRPLSNWTPSNPIVAGAAFDTEGRLRLVLDPDRLVDTTTTIMSAPTAAPAPRLPVLVVDDSLTTRMLEQSILESAGYVVDMATTGEQALEMARATSYALFLVDVDMPGMDGFTFIEHIRREPALARIPAILVTSRDAAEDRQRGQDVGAHGYLVKSEFDQAALLAQIRELVG